MPLRFAPAPGWLVLFPALVACSGADHLRGAAPERDVDPSGDWLEGPTASAPVAALPPRTASTARGDRVGESFRNTYYDFPREGVGAQEATLFDAACAPITRVTQTFHDQVCVQGSGRIRSGATVSFAKRDCACAAVCPRSGQKICFERLDPKAFPAGRGAMGKPVIPLRSIAVDPEVIPLGTTVYIAAYEGLPMEDGKPHDGCFLAEDRGSKVLGHHVDVFTGDPAMTKQWNQLVPSNQGVWVELSAPRCAFLLQGR